METLDLFRPSVGAYTLGMAQSALDATVAYTAQREAFGDTLADLQAVQHKVADMATSVAAARHLVYDAARCYDTGGDGLTGRSAMAKLFATEAAQRVIDDAVQLHGAVALRKGHLLEKLYREVRAPVSTRGRPRYSAPSLPRICTPPAERPGQDVPLLALPGSGTLIVIG